MPQAAEKALWFALEVSGYQDASVASMLVIFAAIVTVWAWGKPWLQKKLQKTHGRKKWTSSYPTVVASVLTMVILAIPTFYKIPTSLKIDIQEAYIIDQTSNYKVLIILANVHNMSESPIVPENFQIRVLEWGNLLGPFDSLPFPGKWFILYPSDVKGDKTLAIEGHEFLERRLMEKPVTQGMPVNGWMIFDLLGVRDWRSASFSLDFHDSYGKNGKIALELPRRVPPIPDDVKFHRGVTYPFKEKSAIPQG